MHAGRWGEQFPEPQDLKPSQPPLGKSACWHMHASTFCVAAYSCETCSIPTGTPRTGCQAWIAWNPSPEIPFILYKFLPRVRRTQGWVGGKRIQAMPCRAEVPQVMLEPKWRRRHSYEFRSYPIHPWDLSAGGNCYSHSSLFYPTSPRAARSKTLPTTLR